MKRSSTAKILTTHVGSLPDSSKQFESEQELQAAIAKAVSDQRAIGLDIINDGEHTKSGDWLRYIETRLGGFEKEEATTTVYTQGKDREVFADYYASAQVTLEASASARRPRGRHNWVCVGPIEYTGRDILARSLALFKSTLKSGEEAFVTTTAPGSFEPYRINRYYRSQEEFLYALAEAMRVEYRTIVDAGLLVQVDDAWLAALWDRIGIDMGLEKFRSYCALRIDVLNHALSGIPPERVRYHHCWGSWHGPHVFDLPLADIVDLLLRINAGAYLLEAANARHEHEFGVWERVKLPDGKILIPGIVSHATPVVEHPDLVAYRIKRFTRIVGAENFIAGADCGFGGRVHPQVGWAKLKALVEGAALCT